MSETEGFLSLCIRKGVSFFSVAMPGCASVSGASLQASEGLRRNCFIYSPFESQGRRPTAIAASLDVNEIESLPDSTVYSAAPEAESDTPIYIKECATTFEEYADGLQPIIDYHKIHGGKTVYSRLITGISPGMDADKLFSRLRTLYPQATVFCFATPRDGVWIGATPELLLTRRGDEIESMALAGTRPAGTSGDWDSKNIEEQRMVTDFVVDVFRRHGLMVDPSSLCPVTLGAGPVEHLCTKIKSNDAARLSADGNETETLESLLQALSPTPALCGSTRDASLQLIHRYERHQRGCYGGYFGLINGDGDFNLYVNLRSVRYYGGGQYRLYCGGGITAHSTVADEWEETCRKSQVMLAALSEEGIQQKQ